MVTTLETAPVVAGALGVGGVGVWASGRRELIRRWLTWAVTAPVVGGALYFGAPGAAALAAALAVVASVEYGGLVRLAAADRVVVGLATGGMPIAAWLLPAQAPRLLLGAVVVAALMPVLSGDATDGARRAAYTIFGVVWLSALTGLVLLGSHAFVLCLAVSVADVGAWCGGRLLGGPKLSPLSPAKRWGGIVGGAVAGLAVLALLGALTPALAVAVVAGAPLGDLLESMLKRGAGVKDAGTWLPGFGGLLDRVDSLLVALALAVVLS